MSGYLRAARRSAGVDDSSEPPQSGAIVLLVSVTPDQTQSGTVIEIELEVEAVKQCCDFLWSVCMVFVCIKDSLLSLPATLTYSQRMEKEPYGSTKKLPRTISFYLSKRRFFPAKFAQPFAIIASSQTIIQCEKTS
jgi:hypothetical protein